jgi:hypothetical protein
VKWLLLVRGILTASTSVGSVRSVKSVGIRMCVNTVPSRKVGRRSRDVAIRHPRFLHEFLNQFPSLFVAHPHRLMDQHASLESRILGVKARPRVSIAVEQPDWNFLTPF